MFIQHSAGNKEELSCHRHCFLSSCVNTIKGECEQISSPSAWDKQILHPGY